MTVRDNRDYSKVFLYSSSYTTVTGWGGPPNVNHNPAFETPRIQSTSPTSNPRKSKTCPNEPPKPPPKPNYIGEPRGLLGGSIFVGSFRGSGFGVVGRLFKLRASRCKFPGTPYRRLMKTSLFLLTLRRPQDRTIRYKVLKVLQGVKSHPCICEASCELFAGVPTW